MKKIYALLFVLPYLQGLWAQEGDYRPILEEGKVWTVASFRLLNYVFQPNKFSFCETWEYTAQGDTVIGDKTWKKIYITSYTNYEKGISEHFDDRLARIMREENGRLYFIPSRGMTDGWCIVDFNWEKEEEFNLPVGYNNMMDISINAENYDFTVTEAGEESRGGRTARCVTLLRKDIPEEYVELFNYYDITWEPCVWMEGVGELINGFSNACCLYPQPYMQGFLLQQHLIQCRLGDEILYENTEAMEALTGTPNIQVAAPKFGYSYDLQGCRLAAPPSHGVYIQGGRKYAK